MSVGLGFMGDWSGCGDQRAYSFFVFFVSIYGSVCVRMCGCMRVYVGLYVGLNVCACMWVHYVRLYMCVCMQATKKQNVSVLVGRCEWDIFNVRMLSNIQYII